MKILCLLLCLTLSGCVTFWGSDDTIGSTPPASPKETVKLATKSVEKTSEVIKEVVVKSNKSVDIIKDEADKIDEKTKGAVKPEVAIIKSEADKIKVLNSQLSNERANLNSAKELLSKSQSVIEDRDKTINELLIKVDESNAAAKKSLNEKLVYMIIGGIILIGICVASAINGNGKAIGGAVVGVIIVICCITIMYMSPQLAWVGVIAIISAMVLLFIKVKRDLDLKKANTELIHSTEAIKDSLDPKKKAELFGTGAKPGMLFNIQSQTTEQIVNEERRKKQNMWQPTITK
tara:strand:+ start:3975 stop:4847 length:873 start_codon:yes stop_codon:yes gene_type:complete